jgi:exo-1,4-beta-D-glucosaminidase
MSTLLENRGYNEADLFYSTNLQNVDSAQFRVPWYYRAELLTSLTNGSYYQLKTHGISSKADIYLNGKQIANSNVQAGSYTGLNYDITGNLTTGTNVILVKVYPTDYNRDLALGFVDWNPSPPDNGTGLWRNVEIKQSGPVAISTPRIVTTLKGVISIRLDVKNLQDRGTQGEVTCSVADPAGKEIATQRAEFRMNTGLQQKLELNVTVTRPQLWWPRQWGAQPLYSVECKASTGAGISDTTGRTKFGVRTVSSILTATNDTKFYINNNPFQVLGAGYTSDIFLRFSEQKLRKQFEYMLDMGLNTVRLEGKQEHPYLYDLADELGLMVMAGWECCDKWEGWSYNNEGSGLKWTDADYSIANLSMRHEAEMMQSHPSMLTFLVGSDFWPDDKATKIYVDALHAYDWNIPIISSASQRGSPKLLGNGGMKMEGPYDWVPPNYWYDDQLGAAFGFASELGAGAGTPELNSLKKFLSPSDLDDLWKQPKKGLYHMSTASSQFYTREIYNDALWKRYGAPTSLEDYLLKSQMADYETTRAQFESYAASWNLSRPATGAIYWMLNNAWPSLHWNLFDYYLHPHATYFGSKVALRREHVAYDYKTESIWLINRRTDKAGMRTIEYELISLNGTVLFKDFVDWATEPLSSRWGSTIGLGMLEDAPGGVGLLKLRLHNRKDTISRNVYWVSNTRDVLSWENSTWYYTPTAYYANYTALQTMAKADVAVTASGNKITLDNRATVPAVFIRLNLVDSTGSDILPVEWSDNYVTLWPKEKLELTVEYEGAVGGARIQVSGRNIAAQTVALGGYP